MCFEGKRKSVDARSLGGVSRSSVWLRVWSSKKEIAPWGFKDSANSFDLLGETFGKKFTLSTFLGRIHGVTTVN